jgi:hypothetical protein
MLATCGSGGVRPFTAGGGNGSLGGELPHSRQHVTAANFM